MVFIDKYKTLKTKLLVSDSYGLLLVSPDDLLSGSVPTIKSAIDKNEYFINKANSIHGDAYNYSLLDFKSHNKKVNIICKTHGLFKQTPYHHLFGHGCLLCGHDSSLGKYSPNNAEKYKQDWSNKDAILYVISFLENEEKIYKIGITTTSIKERYRIENQFKYDYDVEVEIKNSLYNCCHLEHKLHSHFSSKSYTPQIKFGGYTECFKDIELKEVENIVQANI